MVCFLLLPRFIGLLPLNMSFVGTRGVLALAKFSFIPRNEKFFDLFEVGEVRRQRLASDDVELMKFAFDWLKFSLFGEETSTIEIHAHRTS